MDPGELELVEAEAGHSMLARGVGLPCAHGHFGGFSAVGSGEYNIPSRPFFILTRGGVRPTFSLSSVSYLRSPLLLHTPDSRCDLGSFLSPPQGAFISVLERELYTVFFVTATWA